ncbi:hypothetical protein D3C79_811690 [compost metagenome]
MHVLQAEAEHLGGLRLVAVIVGRHQQLRVGQIVVGGAGQAQVLHQLLIEGVVEEVGQGDVVGVRRMATGPLGQVSVGDDPVHLIVELIDGAVGHADVEPGGLHPLAQHAGPHGAGAHARIAGDHYVAHRHQFAARLLGRRGFGFGTLHGLHLAGGFTQGVGFVRFRLLGTDEHGGDQEGDQGRADDGEHDPDQGGLGRHQQHGEDGAR